MSGTRWSHLTDTYNALARAKKLVAMAQAAMPANRPNDLNEANRVRISQMIAHCNDAIACGQAALEVDVNAEVEE